MLIAWIILIVFFGLFSVMRRARWSMMLYVVAVSLALSYLLNGWMMVLLPLTAFIAWALTSQMHRQEGWKRLMLLILTITLVILPFLTYKLLPILQTLLPCVATPPLWGGREGSFLWGGQEGFSFVGISFYTLQAISHAIDVYRKEYTEKVTLLEYLFYLTFFPLLFAGPITRASTLFPQIRKNEAPKERILYSGLFLLMSGVVKKFVVADYLAQYNDLVFGNPAAYNSLETMMAAWGYGMQIYLDFSGYTDMALGIARMMGFRLKDNFMFPYQALNIQEFWHRWHISLASWFRDYIYIPLGGSRRDLARTLLNIIIVFLLVGLWHGINEVYLLWGLIHGLLLAAYRIIKPWLSNIRDTWLTKTVSWLVMAFTVTCTWVLFRSQSLEVCAQMFRQMTGSITWTDMVTFAGARTLWFILMLTASLFLCLQKNTLKWLHDHFVSSYWLVKLALMYLLVQAVIIFQTSNVVPFLYFQY